MYTTVTLADALGVNNVNLDEFPYPLQVLDWDYSLKGDDIPRAFAYGQFDTRKPIDFMTINCEGEIVETTTALYWTSRKTLLACVLPDPEPNIDIYNHSILTLTLDDGSIVTAKVTLASFSVPVAAKGSPTVSPFLFSWKCNVGYWSDAATGAPVLL